MRAIYRYHPAVSACFLALWLLLAGIAAGLWGVLSEADAGRFVREERMRYGKSSVLELLVDGPGGLHPIAGFQPWTGAYAAGQILEKVPGDFFVHAAPRGRPDHLPRWFQNNALGLGWIVLGVGGLLLSWWWVSRKFLMRALPEGDNLRFEYALIPGVVYAGYQIPLGARWRCWLEPGLTYNVTANPGFGPDLCLATRTTKAEASRLAALFVSWVQPRVEGHVLEVDPDLAERMGVSCPVCGTGARGTWRMCARCDTPHHRGCWRRLGHCSTLACGGQRLAYPA